jgi:hypothetical protein
MLLQSIPGGFGCEFLRMRLHFSVPDGKDTLFPRRTVLQSIPGLIEQCFPVRTIFRKRKSFEKKKNFPTQNLTKSLKISIS